MVKQRVIQEIENPYTTGEDFGKLFELSAKHAPEEGSVVKGRIIEIANDNVVIDLGFKTEGRVNIKDFPLSEREDIKVGDTVEVFLEKIENRNAEAVVSRERAIREESWERLETKYKNEENVDGIIFGRVKGGFTVDLDGAVAFLPGSQVDVRPVKDITPLMNVAQPFQILKMDRKRGNIVVSRRAILEENRSAERDEVMSEINEGDILEGVVKNITDYGAFIDLGLVDGLLHVTDISWKRISHPSEVLNVGETIKVKVIKFDEKNQRISLGLKQMEESPWDEAAEGFTEGSVHSGHITNITDYGAFVELADGIEGLVHVSEMSWTKKNVHPSKIISQGEEVKVKILSIDKDKHRLSLGIKQCQQNPWDTFGNDFKIGSVVEGEVNSITNFGIFVGFDNTEIEGLVHVSDLSWDEDSEKELKNYNKGDKVKVKVLEINPEKERVGLGIKQLDKSGSEAVGGLKRGDVGTFTVTEVNENGIEVEVAEGVTSFIRKSDLARERVECRPDRFSVGDRVDAKVTSAEGRNVKLSIKAMEIDEQKRAIKEFGSADSGASLGDILGVAIDSAKEKSKKD